MYNAIIIDDEPKAQNSLRLIISEYCNDIQVVDTADGVKTGVKLIAEVQPDIVFLDIDMQDGTGFDLLSQLPDRNFSLIFCTAHNDFAIKAFKFNAIDYILKPLDIEEVISAANKAVDDINLKQQNVAVEHLLDFYQNQDKKTERIILKTASDIYIVNIQDIYHCKSEGSYTTFNIVDREKITVSRNLKEYEALFQSHNFIRIHQSHLINLNYVERLHKADGGYVVMKNNDRIPISTRKKDLLINALGNIG